MYSIKMLASAFANNAYGVDHDLNPSKPFEPYLGTDITTKIAVDIFRAGIALRRRSRVTHTGTNLMPLPVQRSQQMRADKSAGTAQQNVHSQSSSSSLSVISVETEI